jgi:fatty acid desaturase
MVLGPLVYGARFWRRFVASWPTDRGARRQGLAHLAWVALILTVVVASPLPLWEYLLGAGWFGASISLVRSFAEHRAVVTGSRTAVVRSGRFFSLLFLNNNLHATHHAHPGLAWYRIPAVHAMSTFDQESAAGAGLYDGYGEVVRRFCFRPTWIPVHPRSLQNS